MIKNRFLSGDTVDGQVELKWPDYILEDKTAEKLDIIIIFS